MSEGKKNIIEEWVTAAQKFTAGKSRYFDFVIATLKAGDDLGSYGGIGNHADDRSRITMMLGMAIAAASIQTGEKISIQKGKIAASPKAIEAIEDCLLAHKGEHPSSNSDYLGYHTFRERLETHAIVTLLTEASKYDISSSRISPASIRRGTGNARRQSLQRLRQRRADLG